MKLEHARFNENTAIDNIYYQMALEDWKPDVVVGVSRGGLTPAVVLSHALGVPMVPIVWSSRDFIANTVNANSLVEGYKNILVVDDIVDSGLTVGELQAVLGSEGQDVRYAAMFLRYTSDILPDYIGTTINHDAWIEFSWEIQATELRNKYV